ncbi:MAG: ATP-binding cassette domain-containing protein [Rhodobacteraceae bacterium]|nr:ATP-binding cassette domain-containing protein [Paracoccaceae bacterium]MCY4249897.1 ATP-binding cassette domain-containing protein [Paracoccaceae bacterium]MCY4307981.1 ATP-binding cassette domain-containing protein [Paracoccaceae bacterium]
MSQPLIQLQEISKSFGENHVLKKLDLTLNVGESVALIGGSGTGKSVALKIILGLYHPDSGHVLINGERSKPPFEGFLSQIGMLFQGGALFDSLPVWKNVAFKLLRDRKRHSVGEARKIAEEKLERVGLGSEVADLYPAELSGGMQKRAGLARAIVDNPKILFFDEPTTGLDPIRAANISALIREIVDENAATSLTVSHDMACVKQIADKVNFLKGGYIAWSGTETEFENITEGTIYHFVKGLPDPTEVES